jgi:hypothetical protein
MKNYRSNSWPSDQAAKTKDGSQVIGYAPGILREQMQAALPAPDASQRQVKAAAFSLLRSLFCRRSQRFSARF